MKSLAPIILFVYNRPWHTQQTVEALQQNELASESELYIYSDASKTKQDQLKVQEVRNYIHLISGFKKVIIIEREENWGLADSIIDGVTNILNQYGRIIVLEDDMVTSPYFLRFMNDGLEIYRNDVQVASIHGYIYPVKNRNDLPETFFIRGADCWGWATWNRAWGTFNPDGKILLAKIKGSSKEIQSKFTFSGEYNYIGMLENQIAGKNNSWAIRWYASAFLNGMFTLYPLTSFVKNIGNDNSGTHCGETKNFDSQLAEYYQVIKRIDINESLIARQAIEQYLYSIKPGFIQKILSTLRRFIP